MFISPVVEIVFRQPLASAERFHRGIRALRSQLGESLSSRPMVDEELAEEPAPSFRIMRQGDVVAEVFGEVPWIELEQLVRRAATQAPGDDG